jgi:hypothetical protein
MSAGTEAGTNSQESNLKTAQIKIWDASGDVPHTTADMCERTWEPIVVQPQPLKRLQLTNALGDRPYKGNITKKVRRDVHKGHHW